AEAAGYRVIASDRSPQGVRSPVRGAIRAADLRDPQAYAALVEGCDHVIHTAAVLDATADPSEMAQVNTQAVTGLYAAARAAGAERFIHMSSAMLYAPGQSGPLPETGRLAHRDEHGRTKLDAEVLLRDAQTGPAWT